MNNGCLVLTQANICVNLCQDKTVELPELRHYLLFTIHYLLFF